MIITSIQELRLASPAHALDSIDGLVGFIDNSEHDFLEDKLGTPLYDALQKWYDENHMTRSSVADYQTGYWNRLLLMAQRVVAFDALGRAAGMQGVSVNNAGINQMVTDDYVKPDPSAVDTYRKTAFAEAMKSLNYMLAELERWVTAAKAGTVPAAAEGEDDSTEGLSPTSVPDGSLTEDQSVATQSPSGDDVAERDAIVALWAKSRYYYLAASMLIPSAVVLQQYLDFDESREKFIRMLPDLRYIQEEIVANAIGEEYLDHLIDVAIKTAGDADPITTKSPVELRIVHQLRRVIVAWLISRTKVLKYDKEQKIQSRDDGVRKMQDACDFIRANQEDILKALDQAAGFPPTAAALLSPQEREALAPDVLQGCLEAEAPFTASPLFVEPEFPAADTAATTTPEASASGSTAPGCNRDGLSMLVTPPLL